MAEINTDISHIGDDLKSAYDEGYKKGMADAQKWISVKDRMPQRSDSNPRFSIRVSIWCGIGAVTAQYDFEQQLWWNDANRVKCGTARIYGDSVNVNDWLPTPKPPKED